LLYINDFNNSAPKLKFHLFADDSNLFYSDNNLQNLERILNEQLILVGKWLCANKLPQKKVNYSMNLKIHNNKMKEKKSVKYLGVIIDCNLNWKDHVFELCKKISKGIGILFKLRDFFSIDTLIQVYYSVIYPFLMYAVLVWGHTYKSNLHPLLILQKRL
jgi:hypothetical protein